MNIVVCVKPVPDPEQYDKLRLDPVTKRLVREGIDSIVNPTDKNALEAGLALRDKFGGKVIVVAMCPDFNAPQIKECLAMGADEAYILSDRAFGGADTFATSYTLVQGFKKIGIEADIVLGGNESADGATSQMISQIGEWMELPHVSNIIDMEVEDGIAKVKKKTPNGYVAYEVELPAVIGIARGANKPRMVTAMGIIKSKNKPLTIYVNPDLPSQSRLLHTSPYLHYLWLSGVLLGFFAWIAALHQHIMYKSGRVIRYKKNKTYKYITLRKSQLKH